MPNIIEQQDLLKGLPDSRLAQLMQQPMGDIPPFLVAAEAQRRQAIRQQFSGQSSNESVVDTLTQQMAKVPQNLNVPMQTPPSIPQGIAGLGQQQGQQQMAHGGMVQRYDDGGTVQGYYRYGPRGIGAPPTRVNNNVSVLAGLKSFLFPEQPGVVAPSADILSAPTVQSFADAAKQKRASDQISATTAESSDGYIDPFVSAGARLPQGQPIVPTAAPKVEERDPSAGDDDTSDENKIRSRIEQLYGNTEPSSWENAQKWFAMSQQFFDPSLTTGQSIANAGMAFAQSAGEVAAAQRENERAKAEALLKYDIDAQQSAAANQSASLKARTEIATGQMSDLRRVQTDLAGRIRDIQKAIDSGTIVDPAVAVKEQAELQRQIDDIGAKISAYEGFIGQTYGFNTMPVVDTASNSIRYPGT